jgi:hypothetical protein
MHIFYKFEKYCKLENHFKIMKRVIPLILIFISFNLSSCEKVYRDEIFNDQYIVIYGEWRHFETAGGVISTEPYTVKFTPIGKFSYNKGKTGIVTIKKQNENALIMDFNSLFPEVSEAYIGFHGDDTMSIADIGNVMPYRLFVRIK